MESYAIFIIILVSTSDSIDHLLRNKISLIAFFYCDEIGLTWKWTFQQNVYGISDVHMVLQLSAP